MTYVFSCNITREWNIYTLCVIFTKNPSSESLVRIFTVYSSLRQICVFKKSGLES